MKKSHLLFSTLLLTSITSSAQRTYLYNEPPKAPAAPTNTKPAPAPLAEGLFGVMRQGEDWYFVIPDTLLGRPFLSTTRYIATPVGLDMYGGELVNEQLFYWEKKDDHLLLRGLAFDAVATEGSAIAKAVKSSAETPIIASLKIEGVSYKREANKPSAETDKKSKQPTTLSDTTQTANDSTQSSAPKERESRVRYRVKVTDLFRADNPALALDPEIKTRVRVGSMRPDLSSIDSIRTYPINTEVSTTRTYTALPNNKTIGGQTTGLLTFRLNTSFILLPETPMRPRYLDPRVGYFEDSYMTFDDSQQRLRRQEIATRWRLEPREEDLDKMRRGELVEPKKPIVFYIDPATPKQWRPYLIAGVNDWQAAFEQAGFKNAIYALEWPEDDPTMSLEDARFSIIRYLASPTANAYGPHVHDPRSGEILESHIGWYHNVMQLLHDWYMTQAGAIDGRAQKMHFDEELMGQLIRFVSSHEVGHTLGLRHNMGSSSQTPVEKLRDKEWVEKHGHTASIMDYARFNYVAQPEDKIDVAGIYPRINDYDKWAIEWGYKFFPDAKSADEERRILNKITVDRLNNNPRLWFGGEGTDNDPNAQTEDIGDDAMIASTYGLKNLRRVVENLDKWTYEEGDMGENLAQMYSSVVGQYRRYIGHVCRNIGGIHHEYKSVEQAGAVYRPMDRQRQRRAIEWLKTNVINRPSWMIEQPYTSRLSQNPEALITPLADGAVAQLVSAATIGNVAKYAYAANGYQPTEYVDDVLNMIFPATGAKSTTWTRFIQQNAVQRLIKNWKASTDPNVRPYMTSLLQKIQQRLANTAPDAATAAHQTDLRQQIKLALEGK